MRGYCDLNVLRVMCGGRAPNAAEAEAVSTLKAAIYSRGVVLVHSFAHEFELADYENRVVKACCRRLLRLATVAIRRGRDVDRRRTSLRRLGLGRMDATHVACAHEAGAALLTFDNQMRAAAARAILSAPVLSPAEWRRTFGGRLEEA